MSLDCNDIQSRMNALKTLKEQFDLAYHQKDFIKAKDAKKALEQAFLEIKQPLLHHVAERGTLLNHPLFVENIANSIEEIDNNTLAYIGPLQKDIFKYLPEYIYTKYPEQRIYREALEVGGDNVKQLRQRFKKQRCKIRDVTDEILDTFSFKQSLYTDLSCAELKEPKTLNLIHITVGQLGFSQGATIEQIYDRAQELGLQLCPPSVGPYYRLKYTDQPLNELRIVGMNPILSGGRPNVFALERDDDGLWLIDFWQGSMGFFETWSSELKLIFCIQKVSS